MILTYFLPHLSPIIASLVAFPLSWSEDITRTEEMLSLEHENFLPHVSDYMCLVMLKSMEWEVAFVLSYLEQEVKYQS